MDPVPGGRHVADTVDMKQPEQPGRVVGSGLGRV